MNIGGIIWREVVIEKLAVKHSVSPEEVEEALENEEEPAKIRFIEQGEREGEHVYMALGRTEAGRYLTVLFILKQMREALIVSARDMSDKERRQYGRS